MARAEPHFLLKTQRPPGCGSPIQLPGGDIEDLHESFADIAFDPFVENRAEEFAVLFRLDAPIRDRHAAVILLIRARRRGQIQPELGRLRIRQPLD
jgi:hypothetical protein